MSSKSCTGCEFPRICPSTQDHLISSGVGGGGGGGIGKKYNLHAAGCKVIVWENIKKMFFAKYWPRINLEQKLFYQPSPTSSNEPSIEGDQHWCQCSRIFRLYYVIIADSNFDHSDTVPQLMKIESQIFWEPFEIIWDKKWWGRFVNFEGTFSKVSLKLIYR